MKTQRSIYNSNSIIDGHLLKHQTFPVLIKIYVMSLFLILIPLFAIFAHAENPENKKCRSKLYELKELSADVHGKYAPQPMERFYDGKGFIASVDGFDDDNGDNEREYLAQPNWVAYHLENTTNTYKSYEMPTSWYRINEFDTERTYYDSNKPIDDSYRGEEDEWKRGYLASPDDLSRLGAEYGCNSHVFANAVPQNSKLDQEKDSWYELETKMAELAEEETTKVWVVAGPIYDKDEKLKWIGEYGEVPVAVPDALFKIVFVENKNKNTLHVSSFIFKNQPNNNSYCDHAKPLKDIEKETKLSFNIPYKRIGGAHILCEDDIVYSIDTKQQATYSNKRIKELCTEPNPEDVLSALVDRFERIPNKDSAEIGESVDQISLINTTELIREWLSRACEVNFRDHYLNEPKP